MSDKVKIVLTVEGKELVFHPNKTAYNKLLNEMTMDNKVAPVNAYLHRIIAPESKAALSEILTEHVGAEMQISEVINDRYVPKLDIELKN